MKNILINYLEDKGFNKRVIDETIKKLESVNLLNVRAYVEAYVNDKVNLGNSGPYKIKKELVNSIAKVIFLIFCPLLIH